MGSFSNWFNGTAPQLYNADTDDAKAGRTFGTNPNTSLNVQGTQAQGAQLNTSGYGGVAGQQQGLANSLSAVANGGGPSAAGIAAGNQRQAALSQGAALQAGGRGRSAVGSAIAGNAQASQGVQNAAQNEATGRANEMATARNQQGGVLQGMAGNELNIAGQNAQLGQQANEYNASNQQNANLANQQTQYGIGSQELQARQHQGDMQFTNLDPGSQGQGWQTVGALGGAALGLAGLRHGGVISPPRFSGFARYGHGAVVSGPDSPKSQAAGKELDRLRSSKNDGPAAREANAEYQRLQDRWRPGGAPVTHGIDDISDDDVDVRPVPRPAPKVTFREPIVTWREHPLQYEIDGHPALSWGGGHETWTDGSDITRPPPGGPYLGPLPKGYRMKQDDDMDVIDWGHGASSIFPNDYTSPTGPGDLGSAPGEIQMDPMQARERFRNYQAESLDRHGTPHPYLGPGIPDDTEGARPLQWRNPLAERLDARGHHNPTVSAQPGPNPDPYSDRPPLREEVDPNYQPQGSNYYDSRYSGGQAPKTIRVGAGPLDAPSSVEQRIRANYPNPWTYDPAPTNRLYSDLRHDDSSPGDDPAIPKMADGGIAIGGGIPQQQMMGIGSRRAPISSGDLNGWRNFAQGVTALMGGAMHGAKPGQGGMGGNATMGADPMGNGMSPTTFGTAAPAAPTSDLSGLAGGLAPLAHGAAIRGPTRALIGEAGPEAVVDVRGVVDRPTIANLGHGGRTQAVIPLSKGHGGDRLRIISDLVRALGGSR